MCASNIVCCALHSMEQKRVKPMGMESKMLPSQAMLKAFDAYGRTMGIRSAAKLLDVDHAVVSRHLNSLQKLVGVELIDRSTRMLTPEGEQYHCRISSALEEISNATLVLQRHLSEEILVWCSPGIAYHWLGPRLAQIKSVDLQLRPSDRSPNFRSNEADGDIRYIRPGDEDLYGGEVRVMEFARPMVFPFASPDYAARISSQLSEPRDLLQFDLLHEESDLEWRGWFEHQGVADIPESLPGARLWQAHQTLDAARSGRGIALANDFLVQDMLAAGQLVRLSPAEGDFVTPVLGAYCFVTRKDRWSAHGVARFRNWLISSAKELD